QVVVAVHDLAPDGRQDQLVVVVGGGKPGKVVMAEGLPVDEAAEEDQVGAEQQDEEGQDAAARAQPLGSAHPLRRGLAPRVTAPGRRSGRRWYRPLPGPRPGLRPRAAPAAAARARSGRRCRARTASGPAAPCPAFAPPPPPGSAPGPGPAGIAAGPARQAAGPAGP